MAVAHIQEAAAKMDDEKDNSVEPKRSTGIVGQVKDFWHDVVSEMKKVSWPSRQEVINTTTITILAVFFFATYLFLSDLVLTYAIKGIEWVANKIF